MVPSWKRSQARQTILIFRNKLSHFVKPGSDTISPGCLFDGRAVSCSLTSHEPAPFRSTAERSDSAGVRRRHSSRIEPGDEAPHPPDKFPLGRYRSRGPQGSRCLVKLTWAVHRASQPVACSTESSKTPLLGKPLQHAYISSPTPPKSPQHCY